MTVAIVGAAETTDLGVIPNLSQIQLHADAALNTMADAGLTAGTFSGSFPYSTIEERYSASLGSAWMRPTRQLKIPG